MGDAQGGEGLFFTSFTGPGRVWLQGLPFDRIVDFVARHVGRPGGHGVVPVGLGSTGGGGGGGSGGGGGEVGGSRADTGSLIGSGVGGAMGGASLGVLRCC